MIKVNKVTKKYKDQFALNNVEFSVAPGSIVGLLGPNGAGKTTLIKALIGQARYNGEIEVMGYNPKTQRHELMNDVSYIADVAVLPSWMYVWQVIEYFDGVHKQFDREKAMRLLEESSVTLNKKIKQLSKGMIVQLHLACVLSIDVKLLILDEPTLGLDILYRKRFYEQLISDFFDEDRTIIITSHQVEEVEHLLSEVMFIKDGSLVLHDSMENVSDRFVSLIVNEAGLEQARSFNPIYEKAGFGKHILTYENPEKDKLEELGQLQVPSITDLFTATMKGAKA